MGKLNNILGVALFALALAGGLFFGGGSWKGVVYLADGTMVSSQTGRNPAAIRHELDFSKLNGADLITATQKRLVTAARVIVRDGSVGVELGHFVTRDSTGQRRLACDMFFNRLTLRFEANGIATGGEKPMMEIDGPCTASATDISSIEPIWIPVKRILKTRALDSGLENAEGAKFKFTNMQGDWPPSWSLESVRLYNTEQADREVSISAHELHELRAHPFVVNWLDAKRAPGATAKAVDPDADKAQH